MNIRDIRYVLINTEFVVELNNFFFLTLSFIFFLYEHNVNLFPFLHLYDNEYIQCVNITEFKKYFIMKYIIFPPSFNVVHRCKKCKNTFGVNFN